MERSDEVCFLGHASNDVILLFGKWQGYTASFWGQQLTLLYQESCLKLTVYLCPLVSMNMSTACRSLDSSHSITSPQSSSHSSQDSLHRSSQQMQPSHSGMGMIGPRGKKKTGFKSSLGRIFSKKEKGRKDLYMSSGGRGELTSESELRLAAQDSMLTVDITR